MAFKNKELANAYYKKWYAKNKARRIEINRLSVNRKREIVNKIKLDRGCIDCGYKDHVEALDFDHISNDKLFNVSRMFRDGYGIQKILDEIAKCVVVCANCHRIRTAERRVSSVG